MSQTEAICPNCKKRYTEKNTFTLRQVNCICGHTFPVNFIAPPAPYNSLDEANGIYELDDAPLAKFQPTNSSSENDDLVTVATLNITDCKNCNLPLTGSVICMSCGYNHKTNELQDTSVNTSPLLIDKVIDKNAHPTLYPNAEAQIKIPGEDIVHALLDEKSPLIVYSLPMITLAACGFNFYTYKNTFLLPTQDAFIQTISMLIALVATHGLILCYTSSILNLSFPSIFKTGLIAGSAILISMNFLEYAISHHTPFTIPFCIVMAFWLPHAIIKKQFKQDTLSSTMTLIITIATQFMLGFIFLKSDLLAHTFPHRFFALWNS